MTLNLSKPILYLITRGATTEATTPDSEEFQHILKHVSAAVTAGVQLIQLREKQLPVQVLFELTAAVVSIARESSTRILVNDRADVAAGAGADGVHLTTRSLTSDTIRNAFGAKLLIGASTHSVVEAREACGQGADFAVFGPIFPSPAKAKYGSPLGLEKLSEAARELTPFPLIALGGVSLENANECLLAGASGIAGITLFGDPNTVSTTVETLKDWRQFH
ncbi:MAG: thiamine-phosphate pyrophosphorylase [Blastocatellia bacterium]|jgi:thiamine-phosphate pyrophosphorylase|nr:thiamine-phosphate pyrophosphorylase [Blastocatellia bacterium]